MRVIHGRNVNQAYNSALWWMKSTGVQEKSRNGAVLVAPYPMATVYTNPWERMLYDSKRDANPFFHIMEAAWMLAGRNDVKLVARYASNMANYSDDSKTLNGAYGFRWRNHFDFDQLYWLVEELRQRPTSRRAHIQMWDPVADCDAVDNNSLDVPCNTGIDFRVRDGHLDMTVYCRSNDIIWGCYGANAVHMSVLQEFVANALQLKVGWYTQVSNNWHIYEPHFPLMFNASTEPYDPYTDNTIKQEGLLPILAPGENYRAFLDELEEFMYDVVNQTTGMSYTHSYIENVLHPIVGSWEAHKAKDPVIAMEVAHTIKDMAVSLACRQWLGRRVK